MSAWREIINSGNASKNQIKRYARLFKLQHYVRQLYARHQNALDNRLSVLQEALADHFGFSAATIRADMSLIASQLGSGWEVG